MYLCADPGWPHSYVPRYLLATKGLKPCNISETHHGLDTKYRRGHKTCLSLFHKLYRISQTPLTQLIALSARDQTASFPFLALSHFGSNHNAETRLSVKLPCLWVCLNSSVIAYWLQLEFAGWNSSWFPWYWRSKRSIHNWFGSFKL